ncbi:MAG: Na+/H+ antiporter [Dermatophilaceae bacterium]
MELLLTVSLILTAVLVVTWVADQVAVSTPLVLMVVGVAASWVPFVHVPPLSPELVLVGLLPPLLYAAAVNTSLVDFRDNLSSIGWLSVGLVAATCATVGVVAWVILPIPLAAGFALGAIVAPPDAVAATSIARQVGLPRRVVTVLEGESLVNDASALVALRTALVALSASVTAGAIALDFARAVVVAVVIGYAVARLAGVVYRHVDDPMITTGLSFFIPFAAYAPTEALRGSGVLAVVVAGLAIGHKAPVVQSAQARVAATSNWRTIQFLLEHTVFLLIGLQARVIVADALEFSDVIGGTRMAVLACAAVLGTVLATRGVWVLATRVLLARQHSRRSEAKANLSIGESVIVGWAGMRGVVTLAAALSLPADTPGRAVLVLIALIVTVGTLLLQGLTLPALARRLDVRGPDPREDALQVAEILQRAGRAGLEAIRATARPGEEEIVAQIADAMNRRVNSAWERLGRRGEDLETPGQAHRRLRLIGIAAQREELLRIRSAGQADQDVLSAVMTALDYEESMVARVADRDELLAGAPVLRPTHARGGCAHLADAPCAVEPLTPQGCPECVVEGTVPVHLRLCLTCGHVGCCDSSPGLHAQRHYRETGHPVMRSFEPGEGWRWCYVDEQLG